MQSRWKIPAITLMLFTVVLLLPIASLANRPGSETLETISANPVPPRDPADLVVRLQGADPTTFNIAPRPAYSVGDVETFFIGGSTGAPTVAKQMELLAADDAVYMWVEQGLGYNQQDLEAVMVVISARVLPTLRDIFGTERDVEGDPHIYVLNVSNAGFGIAGLFNDADRYPNEVVPSSNEINSMILTINPANQGYYLSVFAHEFQHLVQADLDDTEETWVLEGIAELGSALALPEYFDTTRQASYVANYTGYQLNSWESGVNASAYYGGASLFLTYITQLYGEEWVTLMASEPSDGLVGIEKALLGTTDPLSGQPASVNTIFADFVLANALNNPSLADGRYGYTLVNITARALPHFEYNTYPVDMRGATVNQYGTQYISLSSITNQTLTLDFKGQESVNVLPIFPHSGEYFYWGQDANQANAQLTGRFDLRAVETATLSFWTWFDLETYWDYGYISISRDDGASWEVLSTPHTTAEDPYGRAFAPGYSGTSSGTPQRPAPYIGFGLGDALTVTEIQPDTPAQAAGLQTGDELRAINGQPLTPANFFEVLDQYSSGQNITLSVTRAGQPLDLPVTLGAHPTRVISTPISWIQETIDLTPYVGHEVLIRFDYVTDQALTHAGWVLDDIAIAEIGFFDDLETPNATWESAGWVRITNTLPQRYLVQLIEYGEEIRISRLLEPEEGTSGTWQVQMPAGGQARLAISGIAPVTRQPATFDLYIRAE